MERLDSGDASGMESLESWNHGIAGIIGIAGAGGIAGVVVFVDLVVFVDGHALTVDVGDVLRGVVDGG